MKIITTDSFIERSRKIHNNFYDYSKTIYKGTLEEVLITCPVHGDFSQRPNNHLNRHGCPLCKSSKLSILNKINDNDIIERAHLVHNKKYVYEGFSFRHRTTELSKLNIICPKHGKFAQTVKIHLNGNGCSTCRKIDLMNRNGIDFIEKSKNIHGEKYDYSSVSYSGSNTKVEIVCKKHGAFMQRPNDHIMGKGCPCCKESKGESVIANWLDNQKIEYVRQKIFPDCKNINLLRFDFYLPTKNMVIEFDGIQHFRPVVWNSENKEQSERDFKIGQENDRIKNEYAEQNNIFMRRIKYCDNITDKLEEIFLEVKR